MLKGKELGEAIDDAIKLKIAKGLISTKTEVARHFDIKLPSIYDWIKRGTVSKDKLPDLFAYFSDVVGPEHWGLSGSPFGKTKRALPDDQNADEDWLKSLNVDQYGLVKKFALKVAEMGAAEVKATDKIVDGTVDAIKSVSRAKKYKRKESSSD